MLSMKSENHESSAHSNCDFGYREAEKLDLIQVVNVFLINDEVMEKRIKGDVTSLIHKKARTRGTQWRTQDF